MTCDRCDGACCSSILPTSFEERKRIAKYIEENDIKGYNYNSGQNVFNTEYKNVCPFLSPNNHKCAIYSVRPEVCQKYDCNREVGRGNFEHNGKKIVNFYEEFFPDMNILYKPDVKELDKEYQDKKKEVGIK